MKFDYYEETKYFWKSNIFIVILLLRTENICMYIQMYKVYITKKVEVMKLWKNTKIDLQSPLSEANTDVGSYLSSIINSKILVDFMNSRSC